MFLPQAKYCILKRKDINRCKQKQNYGLVNCADTYESSVFVLRFQAWLGLGLLPVERKKLTCLNEKVKQYFIVAHTFEIHFTPLFFILS